MLENKMAYRLSICFLFLTICNLRYAICLYAQAEFVYDARGKRNPFIPLVTSDGRLLKLDKKEGQDNLLIEGIIYDEDGLSYAIVNGEIVKIGDRVGGYYVSKIKKDKITFIKDGQPLELELKKEEE